MLSEGLAEIGDNAFRGCVRLGEVVFPSSLQKIGAHAFRDCALRSVALPTALTSLGDYAFREGSRLSELTISANLLRIGSGVFVGCSALTSLHFDGACARWNAIEKASGWMQGAEIRAVYCIDGIIEQI